MVSKINRLEKTIHFDIGSRGMNGIWTEGELLRAVKRLNLCKNIIVLTGFYLPAAGAVETDGPPGAVAIANALTSLGKNVYFVTDVYNHDFFQSILDENKFRLICYKRGMKLSDLATDIGLIEKELAIVSIERPGRNRYGRYRSMSGNDITQFNEPLDDLILDARKSEYEQVVTLAIGDGGNEIGMGNIYDDIINCVPHGEMIASVINTNYLITAGVSNWGGFAVAHALSLLNPDKNVKIINSELHEKIIKSMVKYGAVDGVTLKNECSVDGFEMDFHNKILWKLKEISR